MPSKYEQEVLDASFEIWQSREQSAQSPTYALPQNQPAQSPTYAQIVAQQAQAAWDLMQFRDRQAEAEFERAQESYRTDLHKSDEQAKAEYGEAAKAHERARKENARALNERMAALGLRSWIAEK